MLIKYLYIVLVVFFILSPFIFILYRSFTYRTYWGIEFVGLKFYSEIPSAYWRALVIHQTSGTISYMVHS